MIKNQVMTLKQSLNKAACAHGVSDVQMLSEGHSGVLKLAAGFSDSLLSLKMETENLKKVNLELQDTSKHRGSSLSQALS